MMAGITDKGPLGALRPMLAAWPAFLDILRSGDWLTLARARLWALAVLIASAGGLVYLVATSDGLNDYQGRPLGTDFSNVYAAGTYVLDGRPAAPFDPRLQHAREMEIFGAKTPFYGWHYPPFFLGVAAALALMPYQLALIVWQGGDACSLSLGDPRDRRDRSHPSPAAGRARRRMRGQARRAGPSLWLLLALAYPGRVREPRPRPQRLPHRRADRASRSFTSTAADPRRRPVRPARLQAAVRPDDPAGAGRDRALAHGVRRGRDRRALVHRRDARVRHGVLARVLRVRRIHARDRARDRRDRLAQDPERVLLGAHVGRAGPARLCDAGRGHARGRARR